MLEFIAKCGQLAINRLSHKEAGIGALSV